MLPVLQPASVLFSRDGAPVLQPLVESLPGRRWGTPAHFCGRVTLCAGFLCPPERLRDFSGRYDKPRELLAATEVNGLL